MRLFSFCSVRLKFWQRTYCAILALFFACLGAVFGVAYSVARQQSYAARISELLAQQHYIVQSFAQDIAALQARNPSAMQALYAYYGRQYSGEGLYFEVFKGGASVYSSIPPECAASAPRPELTTAPATRTYLVRRTVAGRRLFSATALSGTLEDTVLVCSADMEHFYGQWASTARLFCIAGAAISALFALALYLVLRQLYQPLSEVAATANHLAAGKFSARAPVTRRDEFGDLAASLNGMAGTVERQMCELKTVADQRQRLIENLSHEIRTPLAAISGWAETLRGASLSEEEQADAIDTILFESNRVLSLSRQMLELSVLCHDETLPLVPVAVSPLLARVEAVLAPKATARQVCFSVEAAPTFSSVPGDAALLESLLINLADNAIKACAAGGQASICACLTKTGCPCFLVRDNGRGMAPETLENLGQPFYREDKSRSRREGGAGLGVSLCKEIARQHNATLTYESCLGKGTCAALTFTTSTYLPDNLAKTSH
ncbi:MAG: HAMP domain-containing histidine kinase [Faecalibacterium sp.]|jgi:signal transduction histidine kinase|nr:HAMP domain-containing histidine kinase [Faecalibacterium sp.]